MTYNTIKTTSDDKPTIIAAFVEKYKGVGGEL